MAELVGNCLIGQTGGPTAVINASVAGVVSEALNHACIEEVYGSLNGVLGLLGEDFVDLAAESQQAIRGLQSAGLNLDAIIDTTPIAHGGCRPAGRRRV